MRWILFVCFALSSNVFANNEPSFCDHLFTVMTRPNNLVTRRLVAGEWVAEKLRYKSSVGTDAEALIKHEYEMYLLLNPFNQEGYFSRHLGLLKHPSGNRVLTLQYHSGLNLSEYASRAQNLNFSSRLKIFIRWARDMTASVNEAHRRGILLLDIKPEHFMVNENDGHLTVVDFAFASRREEAPLANGQWYEKWGQGDAYAAPELKRYPSAGELGVHSDAFALGKSLERVFRDWVQADMPDTSNGSSMARFAKQIKLRQQIHDEFADLTRLKISERLSVANLLAVFDDIEDLALGEID
jgi:serine/threonine protein kinase